MRAHWEAKPLSDVCEILDSRRRPVTKKDRRAGEYPYYGATGIVDYVDEFIFDEPLVLVGEDGAKWGSGEGTAFSVDGRCWVNNHAHVLRPIRAKLLDDWLVYYLVHEDLSPFVSGLTVPKLNQGNLREIPVPLPPLAEQRRIVAILDEAFEAIATAKANTEKNLQNAREVFATHREAVFAVHNGHVKTERLGKFARFRNGINYTKRSSGRTVLIIGVKDFQNHFWAPLDDLDHVTLDGDLSAVDTVMEGDILTVRSNGNPELIGRCMVVGKLSEQVAHSGFTIRMTVDSATALPAYVCQFMRTRAVRRALIDGGTGLNIKSLNQGMLSDIVVPLPTLSTQEVVVAKIEAMTSQTACLAEVDLRKLAALDELKRSLLHPAFTGAL